MKKWYGIFLMNNSGPDTLVQVVHCHQSEIHLYTLNWNMRAKETQNYRDEEIF